MIYCFKRSYANLNSQFSNNFILSNIYNRNINTYLFKVLNYYYYILINKKLIQSSFNLLLFTVLEITIKSIPDLKFLVH